MQSPSSQYRPRLAATSAGFFSVWADGRGDGAVYGARLDRHGNPLDPFGIQLDNTVDVTPAMSVAVAAAGTDAVIVIDRCQSIDLVRVDADGVATPPRRIAQSGVDCDSLDIATNGTTFLVVWAQHAEIVDRDGTILAGPFLTGIDTRVAAVSDGRDYLIAGISNGSTVLALPVSDAGQTGVPRVVAAAPEPNSVVVASDGHQYLVLTAGSRAQATIVSRDAVERGTAMLNTETTFAARVTWNGHEYVAALAQWVSPALSLRVVRLAADGHRLGGNNLIDEVPRSVGAPFDIAGTDDGAVIAWIHGSLTQPPLSLMAAALSDTSIDTSVTPVPMPLSTSAADERAVRLIRAGETIIATWREATATGVRLEAALLDGDGYARSAPVELGVADPFQYKLAFDGAHLLLVSTLGPSTIILQRFTTALHPFDASPIVLNGTDVVTYRAFDFDLAAANGLALVAWAGIIPGSHDRQIEGVLIRTSDPAPQVSPIAFGAMPMGCFHPTVAWNGHEFLVSAEHSVPQPPGPATDPLHPPDELLGVRVSAEGSILDTAPLTIAPAEDSISSIAAASNGDDFYVVWNAPFAGGIFGARVGGDGTTVGKGALLSPSESGAIDPTVTAIDGDYIVAWGAGALPSVRVDRVELRFIGKPTAFSITTPSDAFYDGPTLSAWQGRVLVGYERVAHEAPYGGVTRVFTRSIDVSAPPRHRPSR